MKRVLMTGLGLFLSCFLASSSFADFTVVSNCQTPNITLAPGRVFGGIVDTTGTLCSTLAAATTIIGKVGIDQTTPGTTNGVQINAALPAGTNLIGKFGIDQTTPGTTNGVQITGGSPQTPATGTGTPTAVTVGVASAQALAAATRTQRLVIQNVSATASVGCALGAAAVLNTGGTFMIGPGQILNLGDGLYIPGDAVNCIASVASTPVTAWSR